MWRKFTEFFYTHQPFSGWLFFGNVPLLYPLLIDGGSVAWGVTGFWAIVCSFIGLLLAPFENDRNRRKELAKAARGITYRRACLTVKPDGEYVNIEYRERPEDIGPQLLWPFYLDKRIDSWRGTERYQYHAADQADEAHERASELRARARMKPIDKHSTEAKLLAKVLEKR